MAISMHRKDMQRKIDEELFTYEQRVLELRTRRNTYTNISTLPLELLVYIFLLVQDDNPLKKWHQITHICRHWRDIAINAPILWTKPPTHDENYTDLMLERSKEASLNIFLDSPVSMGAITAISSHTGRIETLKAFLNAGQLADVWDRLGTSGRIFPQIQSIYIHCPVQRDVAMNWKLPSALMERSTSIHSVHLRGVTFDWEMVAPLNLTYLYLKDVCPITQISIRTLMKFLRQLPHLYHLALDLTNLLSDNPPTTQVTKFALLLLRSLDVSDHNHRYMPFFLSHLSLPMLDDLRICSHTPEDEETCSSNPLTAITTILVNGNFQGSGNLYIDYSYLRISTSNKIIISINIAHVSDVDHDTQFTQQFLRQISPIFPGLVQVRLAILLNSDELVKIFGNMHQLKAIIIYDESSLISALTGALTHRSEKGVLAFSSLDAIGCDDIDWDDIDPDVLTAFCNALLQRSDSATAIKTLYCFDKCPPQWAIDLLNSGGICMEDDDVPLYYGF